MKSKCSKRARWLSATSTLVTRPLARYTSPINVTVGLAVAKKDKKSKKSKDKTSEREISSKASSGGKKKASGHEASDAAPVAKREHQGYPVEAVPSAWWTVIGLVDGAWYEIYEAAKEAECKRFRNSAIDDDSPQFQKYEDISMLPPHHEHIISKEAKGQLKQWLESTSEATKDRRRAASRADEGQRGSTRKRKKAS